MRQTAFMLAVFLGSACAGGGSDGRDVAVTAQPLAVYNRGPSSCDLGFGVNSAVPGVFDCTRAGGDVPISFAKCPAAQWLWKGEPGGYSSATGNPKGNAYCVEYPYTGEVNWGTYPDDQTKRKAWIQEIGGLWVPSISGAVFNGCGKNIRVCLGTPLEPAVTAVHGATVPGCGPTGNAGCAVCSAEQFRRLAVPSANDTCCTSDGDGPEPDWCLRHTLSLTMGNEGAVSTTLLLAPADERASSRSPDSACTEGTCATEYTDLMKVVLERTDAHVDWTGWSGACTGLDRTCRIAMTEERSVQATYLLGGTVSGAVDPAGSEVALPRDDGHLVVREASAIRVAMSATGYTFAHDGVCSCFVPDGDGFLCGRPNARRGTITVTHLASGASRVLDVDFVAPGGPTSGHIGLGECQRLAVERPE